MKAKYTKLCEASAAGFRLTYYLTRSDILIDGAPVTRFGAAVEKSDGERAEVVDISPAPDMAEALISKLCRGLVTPTTLADVVYDEVYAAEMA